MVISSFCIGFILGFIGPAALPVNGFVFGMLLLLLWCFLEAMCLSTWGTTPGKSLLRVRVRNADGSKLNFRSALSRSVDVWIRGLGTGLPGVSIVTLAVAYKTLTTNGITTWDHSRNFSVTHEEIGPARVTVAAIILAVFIAARVFRLIAA